jgi:PKD repeat protein
MEEKQSRFKGPIVLFLALFIIYATLYSASVYSDACPQPCCSVGSKACYFICGSGESDFFSSTKEVLACDYDPGTGTIDLRLNNSLGNEGLYTVYSCFDPYCAGGTTTTAPTTTYMQVTTTTAEGIISTIRLKDLKDVTDTHSIDTSTTVPDDMTDITVSELGSPTVADAGGPYAAAAGALIVFDGSKTSASAGLSKAVWDFGDGTSGIGLRVTHSYSSNGSYRAILSITDEAGKKDEDSRMVHIYSEEMNIQIFVLPKNDDGIYPPGGKFSTVEVNVTYPDGTPVEKAKLTGIIAGKSIQFMEFAEIGNGLYRHSREYGILNADRPFIDIYVNVTDQKGNTANAVKKLRVVYQDSDSLIRVESPLPNKYVVAYGEPLSIQITLFSSAGPVYSGDVYMYDASTNQRYQLQQVGEYYMLDYKVPWDIGKYLNLIFYASFSVNDKDYRAVRERNFELSPDLRLEVIPPVPGATELKLSVAYPAGEPVTEDFLNATIGNTSVTLERIKENGAIFYRANYSMRKTEERPYLWVTDSSGNGAGTYLQPEPVEGSKLSGTDSRMFLAAGALIALLALSLILLRARYNKRHKRMLLVKEYEDLHQKIASLKKIRKSIMHEYYTRKITEQDARKRILDTEKELVMEWANMRSLMQKLGMAPGEMQGKEEIIEWVIEKLKAGENIELIKKGLKDLNIDPLLVEKVRKTLT